MNIAFIYPEELPSKKARSISVINTTNALSKIIQCTLFISSESRLSETEILKYYDIKNRNLKISKVKKSFLGIKSNKIFNTNILKELKQTQFDVVYVRHLKVAKYLLKQKNRTFKIIFEIHEVFYETLSEEKPSFTTKINKLKQLEEYVYKNVDALVFSNKTLQKYINNLFNNIQNRQTVAYNGAGFDLEFNKKDFSSIKEIYYVGNFFKWKGIEDLIKSIVDIEINLNIIGGDSKEREIELKLLCQSLGIADRVNFFGYMPQKEIVDILISKAKICLIPNTKSIQNQFSMPIKLFEYMATSNVIIASDSDIIKEVIVDEKNGFLFEGGNVELLGKAIKKVLDMDGDTLSGVSSRAYEDSLYYTWDERAKHILLLAKAI